MKTLLLTGWTGYIWSHVAVTLLQKWYEVIIIDDLSNSEEKTIHSIEKISSKKPIFYLWDLKNKSDIEAVFKKHAIDGVIHLAGAKAVGESCEKPFYYYENNIIWSLNLFEVMNDYNVRNMIFSSSANVYGPDWISPFTETHIAGDTSNPYGSTKFIIERLLRDLYFHANFNVINLRYFNPVGAHESGLIWEHANQKLWNILPFLLKVAEWKLDQIEVYGDDYDTKDGTWVRDYIHVVDLAQWHLAAFEYILEHSWKIHENINLGTGKWTSVFELIEIVKKETQREIPYTVTSRREIDIATAYCCTQKSKKLLNWEAKRTISQAVKDSWNFIQTHNATTWK